MKRVYSHFTAHTYVDAEHHQAWTIGAHAYNELPDEVAWIILAAHPGKLCDVSEEEDPGAHVCAKEDVRAFGKTPSLAQAMDAPPENSAMPEPAPTVQQRKNLFAARRRSSTFRASEAK